MSSGGLKIVVLTGLISIFSSPLCAHPLCSSAAAGAEDPRTYSERLDKMSLSQLEVEGEQELSLDKNQIEQLIGRMTFANARGANNNGIFKSKYQGITYFIKKLQIRYDFQTDRFRQEAAAAILLGHSGVGPKAGVASHNGNKTVLIIMREQPGVPVTSKFWNFKNISYEDRKKEEGKLQLQIENDLGRKFGNFQEAKSEWFAAVRNSAEVRSALSDYVQRVQEYGLDGADFEIRISCSSIRPVGIIDTTNIWINHKSDKESAIVAELKHLQKTLFGE
ncbi:MAG: hypothetical protein K2X47_11005 [Bdellovibrionales bacterium]|nr:hypothetical protein [Bdellovibrionales bacterium]